MSSQLEKSRNSNETSPVCACACKQLSYWEWGARWSRDEKDTNCKSYGQGWRGAFSAGPECKPPSGSPGLSHLQVAFSLHIPTFLAALNNSLERSPTSFFQEENLSQALGRIGD